MSGLLRKITGILPVIFTIGLLVLLVFHYLKPISIEHPHTYKASGKNIKSPRHIDFFAEANYTEVFPYVSVQRLNKNKVKNYFVCHYSQNPLNSIIIQLSNTAVFCSVNLLFSHLLYLLNCVLLI